MVDINKVICLELRNKHGNRLSDTRLKFISDYLSINFNWLIRLSKEYDKVWIDDCDKNFNLIYVKKDNSLSVYKPYDNLPQSLKESIVNKTPVSIPPNKSHKEVNRPQKEVNRPRKEEVSNLLIDDLINEMNLDLDTILDKITASGIGSLTKSELNFLDTLSKQK
jgi:hypothetical protein